MIFNFYAVVAVAATLQYVAVERLALTAHFTVNVFLVVRTSFAVLVSGLVGVVSLFSFSHYANFSLTKSVVV